MSLLSLLLGSLSTAHAVPVQLTQQGRLLDSNGAAMTGQHIMAFRLFDQQLGGNVLWEEGLQLSFIDGYYSALLGDSGSNPLDDSVLANGPIYMEIEVDGNGPIGLRQEVVSAPYARMAGSAIHVSGGTVNAAEVSIGGQLIIDGAGSWVGPAMAVNWGNLQNVPADLADGDNDTLAGISCNPGEILGWNGSAWDCAADNGLTESEVESFVTNDPLDFAAGSMVGGSEITTLSTDQDSLADLGLSCQDGDVAKWDSALSTWICDIDADAVLSESDVETFVTNGPLDFAAGAMVNGSGIRTMADPNIHDIGCQPGELLSYDSNAGWVCSAFQAMLDADGDGIMSWSDCDDADPTVLSQSYDQDCDGAMTALDCDDTDPFSNTVSTDGDCDGLLTAEDCDDNDASSTSVAEDGDCDGVPSADDCDDADANLGAVSTDADCDGVLSAEDCDDTDPTSNTTANDADCDGTLATNDCDDNDASVSSPGSSASCAESNCQAILSNGNSTGDGQYWIDPDGNGSFEVYCDMTTDGGGWTLVGLNGTNRYTDTSTQWFSSKSYGSVITPTSSGTYGMGGRFPTVSEVLVELELGSPASSAHKIKFDWQDNPPSGMPSGNVSDIVTNVSNAGWLTNNASGCFTGSHHFNEHFAIAWATRDCGNYEVFMIGTHYNGTHQHWEEDLGHNDNDGEGYYYYLRANPGVGSSMSDTSGKVIFWVR